jgi:hypothetical protein
VDHGFFALMASVVNPAERVHILKYFTAFQRLGAALM